MGVHNGCGVRQCFTGAVVIRNHQIKPERGGIFRLLQGAHTVIHRDDELRTSFCHLVNGGAMQTVALGFPFGNIIKDVRALCFQVRIEHRGGGHAVRVIIPIDRNPLKAVQSFSNPRNGFFHIRQAHGVKFRCVRF